MSNASAIIRATTPTIVCTFPNYIDFSKAELIDVTLAQNAKTLTLHFPDVAATGNTIEVYLQQHHSAKLNSGKAEIQINWTYPNGARASSSIESITIGRNLHPDVMPAPIYKGRIRRQDAANGQSETTYVSMDVMSNAASVPMNVESSIVVPGEGGSGSGTQDVTVDSTLSASSANPVQNKVIKAALDTKYEKPVDGIPAEDLTAGIRAQLQAIGSAYQKPENGIPETDLTASVVEKLNRVVSGDGVPVGYVTPEMYGAIGDGVNDDGPALKNALASGRRVMLTQNLYLKTAIQLYDHDIYLDGNDYTIWFDGENLSHTSLNAALLFRASLRNDTEGKIKQVTDPIVMRPVPGSRATYQRGFISYDGRHPIPGEDHYENEVVKSWDEYTAKVRNLTISCHNCAFFMALDIERMCHVEVVNVTAICEDLDGDGAIGIHVSESYHVRIDRCFARNWTALSTAHLSNLGYGIVGNGDDVIVSDCTAENCKHNFSAGGARQYFTTGLIINNFHGYTNWRQLTRSNNTAAYQQSFDIHANALHPIVSNLYLTSENHDSQHPGNWMINIRCPDATLSNIYAISSPGTGYITCTEFAKNIVFNNLFAPNSDVRLYNDSSSADMESVEINGGCCNNLSKDSTRHIERIVIRDFTVTNFVRKFESAEFVNCLIKRIGQWAAQPTVEAYGKIIFRGCTIVGNRSSGDNRALGFLGASDGVTLVDRALRFYDCRFICYTDQKIFRQASVVWTSGCWAEDFEGNSFDSDELIPSWIDATLTRHGYAADAAAVGQIPQGGGGQTGSSNALGTGKLGFMRLGARGSSSGDGNSGGSSTATSSMLGTGKLGEMKLGTRETT